MLTTIVVVLLFFVAFLMVAYEWATYLWVILLMGTIITWLRTVYIEHVKKNVKDYEKVYNLFVVLRVLTVVSAIILGAIWLLTRPFVWPDAREGSVTAPLHRVLWNYCKSAFFICTTYWLLPHFVIKYYSVIEYGIC